MYEDFWDRTNSLIKTKNTTQKALSLHCGFNERRIETLSSYGRSPNVDEAVRIAQALGTTVEYLVTGEDSNPYKQKLDELKAKIKNFYTSL